jgi:hypothetical protein
MVSTMRFKNGEGPRPKPKMIEELRRYGETPDEWIAGLLGPGGFMAEMLRWARIWCTWSGALTVRFERMRLDGPAEVARIAEHLGVACDAAKLYARVFERSATFTGRYSDWRESFGPRSHAAWQTGGGEELLRVMGYE